MQIIDASGWANVGDRTRTGAWAEVLFYDGSLAAPTIRISPKVADGDLELWCYMPLAAVSGLSAAVDFPPGYEHAIRLCLAEVLSTEYGVPLTEALAKQINEAKSGLAALNSQVLGSPSPAPVPAAA